MKRAEGTVRWIEILDLKGTAGKAESMTVMLDPAGYNAPLRITFGTILRVSLRLIEASPLIEALDETRVAPILPANMGNLAADWVLNPMRIERINEGTLLEWPRPYRIASEVSFPWLIDPPRLFLSYAAGAHIVITLTPLGAVRLSRALATAVEEVLIHEGRKALGL